jgi:hypothetical protein
MIGRRVLRGAVPAAYLLSRRGTASESFKSPGAQMVTRVNPIDKHVGSRVRMRRLMLNMSQTEIGDAA